jgi:RNA polymerase sigma-70 factor (ECF subfamily)
VKSPTDSATSPGRLRLVAASDATDGVLVLRYLEGDASAFGELVRRHQDVAWKVARRYAASPDDARDLVQRAVLKAFEAAQRTALGGRGDFHFRAWLLRIVVNLGKNQVRDARRWPSAPAEAVEAFRAPGADPQRALEDAEARRLVQAAVDALPERQRAVFALRVDAGLSFAEVGEALDITEGNARTQFHEALKKLRERVRAVDGARTP